MAPFRFLKCFMLVAFFLQLSSVSSAFVAPTTRTTTTTSDLLIHRPPDIRVPTSSTSLNIDIVGVSPEPIHTAFAFATFGPQPFWLLMILLPRNDITKKVMGSMGTFLDDWTCAAIDLSWLIFPLLSLSIGQMW